MPYWRLFYHLVWATRDREQLIGEHEESIIRQSLQRTGDELKLLPHAIGFMPDHVHVTMSIPPAVAIAEAVRRLKGASAHEVNHSLPNRGFGWQGEYGVFSFGEKNLAQVNRYVLNQAEHHAGNTLIDALELDSAAQPR